jgi:hypothetical protein
MDWKKVGIGALIALGGALFTYVSTIVIPAMEASGDATLLLVAVVASTAINAIRQVAKIKEPTA